MFWKTERDFKSLYFILSLAAALTLWYTVNAREQVERVVEVRLDYKGLPPGLVVTSGQINKLEVRLRGPLELLRSLAGRELSYTVDLSGVTRGNNVIPLVGGRAPEWRSYQVLEVTPSRLTLEVDNILERKLPVKVEFRASPLVSSLRMEDVSVTPGQVTVHGPAAEVGRLRRLTVEVPADLSAEGKQVTTEAAVLAPSSVEVSPTTVTVRRRLVIQRRNISLQRDIITEWTPDRNIFILPSQVNLVVSVPRSAINDAGYLAQIQAWVDLQQPEASGVPPSATEAPVRITLPAGADLVRVSPERVAVLRSEDGRQQDVEEDNFVAPVGPASPDTAADTPRERPSETEEERSE